ncbi:actin interacting protein 3-domain-containing protein, partial [Mycotypha africana]|uniref:actin interacting protein 3-domain-containing protein n=1 Tax=Mycotypha africana TaxID=64632 RepID=UPI002300D57B
SGEIEQVVTKLLRTTKSLLEALTQWSVMRTSKNEVLELHDTLEKQFYLVSQAFEEAGVGMSDLQWIPRQLKESVSVAMLDIPSPHALDQYLPRIREVIVHLLHGLKGKQAMLRERERESRGSIRSTSSTSDSWNREVPLAALNRGSGSQRIMMQQQQQQGSVTSPTLPPSSPSSTAAITHISPRGSSSTDYEPWSGGMPRPSLPTNDLSSRIMPPRMGSTHHMQSTPAPRRSNSSSRSSNVQQQITMPAPPIPPPPAQNSSMPQQQQQSFDENDPNTAIALAALKRQENLARRSSVRRASMYRGDYSGGIVPPVPSLPAHHQLPLKNVDYTIAESSEEVEGENLDNVNKTLTLFLQLGKQVQKVKYGGEISIPALNMLFLEKFSYSIRQDDFPKIYINDPAVGIAYELEDITEVKDKSVLSLNIDGMIEQKEAKKDWLAEITSFFNKEIMETRQIFKEQLDELKKEMTETATKSQLFREEKEKEFLEHIAIHVSNLQQQKHSTTDDNEVSARVSISKNQFEAQRAEIDTLRREIIVLRQLDREIREETSTIISQLKEKTAAIEQETKAGEIQQPTQASVARAHLEKGKKNLLDKSDKVTSRLEELQDTIDQLKLDVTQRKCRPSEAQMTHCANERKALTEEIEEFGKLIAQIRPRWKKTWEHELQTIVNEQQILKDQEYLLSDMKDDLEALLEVFEQLEKIYVYQANAKPKPREFRVAPPEEGYEGMASVMKQVSTIDVDHERRLKALEQADKMRQRELANRIDDFEKELIGFVETKKLKKTGGALEIDRIRKQKDEENLKAMYADKKETAGNPPPLTATNTESAVSDTAKTNEEQPQQEEQEEAV